MSFKIDKKAGGSGPLSEGNIANREIPQSPKIINAITRTIL
jgi:hypothetical protein